MDAPRFIDIELQLLEEIKKLRVEVAILNDKLAHIRNSIKSVKDNEK